MAYLGSLFKAFRERKGLTVSETAEGIVSPQFLRKFERDESDISLTNFLLLMNKINSTVDEFLYECPEISLGSWLEEVELDMDLALHSGNSLIFKRFIQKYEKKYKDSGEQCFYHTVLMGKYLYTHVFNIEFEADSENIIDYLRSIEEWGLYEFFLGTYLIQFFEADELFVITEQAFRRKLHNQTLYYQVIDFLLHVCYRFIQLGQLEYAEKMMGMYEETKTGEPNLKYLPYDTYAAFLRGLILIGRNDPKGAELCRQIIFYLNEVVHHSHYANRMNILYEIFLSKSELTDQLLK